MTSPLYGLRVAATGVSLLSLGAFLVLAMFRSTLGPFYYASDGAPKPAWRVALWTPGGERELDRGRSRWSERLEERFEIDASARFPAHVLDEPERFLLVVDGAAIDRPQARALRNFVEDGGRLALFGIRSPEEEETPEPLSVLLGRPVAAATGYRWSLLPGATGPLSAGFSGAARLPLRLVHTAYTVALPPESREVTWLNADAEAATQGAAWRDTPGRGRLVWWSVQPDGALDRVAAQAAMTRVVRGSIAWLLQEPFAHIAVGDGDPRPVLEAIETRIVHRAGGRYLLSLTNRARVETSALDVRVHLNRKAREVDVVQTTVQIGGDGFNPVSSLRFLDRGAEGERVVAFRGPSLGPGESRSFYLDVK